MPPLREHKEDIEELCNHFLNLFQKGQSIEKKLTHEALQVLQNYHWPGNVRELANVIERSIAFESGDLIEIAALPSYLTGEKASYSFPHPNFPYEEIDLHSVLHDIEDHFISQALHASHGDQEQAARLLRISSQSLKDRLQK